MTLNLNSGFVGVVHTRRYVKTPGSHLLSCAHFTSIRTSLRSKKRQRFLLYNIHHSYTEFNALKRRCFGRHGHSLKCLCFVAVKKEDRNIRRTVLNSVVGTLDLSIRQLLQGETFPGEQVRTCVYMSSNKSGRPHRYGYVANVCVAKFARRQGIASNMLELAIDAAKSCGVKELFVHVNTNNKVAQQLYGKIGFEMVEAAASHLSIEQKQLLCLNTD